MTFEEEKNEKPFELTPVDEFQVGDRISLNTGYACDTGEFIRYIENEFGRCVMWKSSVGGIYTSPLNKYKITNINSPVQKNESQEELWLAVHATIRKCRESQRKRTIPTLMKQFTILRKVKE